jgi:hypothetical protein
MPVKRRFSWARVQFSIKTAWRERPIPPALPIQIFTPRLRRRSLYLQNLYTAVAILDAYRTILQNYLPTSDPWALRWGTYDHHGI